MSDGWIKTERGWRKSYGPPPEPARHSHLACPRIISDTMPPTEHVDGKFYDSKSAFRAVTEAKGYVELGNDTARFKAPQRPKRDSSNLDAAIQKAIAQAT
tara:strand:+ start:422 stop:721 length:300 start_codon:yes stop_codon:yes gene_type:complete